ncbi:hypothetical protein FISHEDRAFT_74881 [Fistulina hepatica ATCC 64428]|uniref:Uncharacterized protein n=1 Tax=Fistulina hepatica ATCC 64428 TaxID=1128425 RepID=A0A0D7A8T0_9AGAR|nr:hypothetical protein FISHEDRAFT_74881 [Fistulina hepatica ATCC 64428]
MDTFTSMRDYSGAKATSLSKVCEAFVTREFSGGKAHSVRQTRRERFTPSPKLDLRTYDAVDALLMLSRSHEHPNVQPSSLKPSKLYSYPKDEIESQKKHRELLVKTFRKKRFATFDAEELMEPGDTEKDFAFHARRARRLIAQEMSRAIKMELNPFVGHFTATQAVCLPCSEWNLLDSRQLFYAGNLVNRHMRGKSGSKTGVNQSHPRDLVQLMIVSTITSPAFTHWPPDNISYFLIIRILYPFASFEALEMLTRLEVLKLVIFDVVDYDAERSIRVSPEPLACIENLDVTPCSFADLQNNIEALMHWFTLPHLPRLRIKGITVVNDEVQELFDIFASELFEHLEELELDCTGINTSDLALHEESPLVTLRISETGESSDALIRLIGSPLSDQIISQFFIFWEKSYDRALEDRA